MYIEELDKEEKELEKEDANSNVIRRKEINDRAEINEVKRNKKVNKIKALNHFGKDIQN